MLKIFFDFFRIFSISEKSEIFRKNGIPLKMKGNFNCFFFVILMGISSKSAQKSAKIVSFFNFEFSKKIIIDFANKIHFLDFFHQMFRPSARSAFAVQMDPAESASAIATRAEYCRGRACSGDCRCRNLQ